jgi:hypothetical protein
MKGANLSDDTHGRRPSHPGGGGSSARTGGLGGLVRPVVLGLVTGAGYAGCLRAWMRLVSTTPEFSWGGTGYIVGVFAVLGGMAGLVSAGRRRGWGPMLVGTRAFGITLSLGCFVAAGTLMLPTIVPAALGWSRSDWPRPLRAGLLLLGTVAAGGVVITLPELSLSRRLLALLIYLLLSPVEVALTARLYAPSLPPGSLGRLGRSVPVVAGAVLVAGLAVLVIGR